MSAITWNTLPKTINDSQTIAGYIAAQLATHNADGSAHGQSDEALYNHRIATILDHLDASVTNPKIGDGAVSPEKSSLNKLVIAPVFETIDALGITKSANSAPFARVGMLYITLDSSAAQYVTVKIEHETNQPYFATKNPFAEALIKTDYNENQTLWFGIGDPTGDFTGFKIDEEKIYAAYTSSGSATLHEITGYTVTNNNHYEIKITSATNAEYYVNGILEHSIAAAVFAGFVASPFLYIKYLNKNSQDQYGYISSLRFYQDH